MTTRTKSPIAPRASRKVLPPYDRSSLKGDFMVMIDGESPEEWERRRPEDQFCEYLDGIIYFHPPKGISSEALNAERGIYDRSSLVGDFMVMIEDQTPEDFEKYAPEGQFCDYLDGIVYMPSPASDRHQDQTAFFHHVIDGFLCERGGGIVRLGSGVLRLDEQRKPEPDLFVVPAPEVTRPDSPKAILVIEVLSDSTRKHDRGEKLAAYRDAGIPEIWLCDDRDRTVIAERLVDGRYHRREYTAGLLESASLPGFWIDLSWLWSDPVPNRRRCLETILAGPPA